MEIGTSTIPSVAASLSARQEEFSVNVSLSISPEEFSGNVSPSASKESQLERPPDYADYRPARTTGEGGGTMLVSGGFLARALVAPGLAVYTKLADVRTFGQIQNLLLFALALLLIAVYLLVWE